MLVAVTSTELVKNKGKEHVSTNIDTKICLILGGFDVYHEIVLISDTKIFYKIEATIFLYESSIIYSLLHHLSHNHL